MKKGETYKIPFSVSEDTYLGFISTFKDENPLHTNEQFATSFGFKSKVMHGNILNGFLSYFIGECLPTKELMIISQTINYKKPVFLDDKLTLNVDTADCFESVGIVEFKYFFANSDDVKVAKGNISIKLL